MAMHIPKTGIFPLPDTGAGNLFKVVLANREMYVEILNIGASICRIVIPDEDKNPLNVILNYPDAGQYRFDTWYLGATVGRVAGRISSGRLKAAGRVFQLPLNDRGRHHLHGGHKGFNRKYFDILQQADFPGISMVKLHAQSPDGEEGYPGELDLTVTYSLLDNNTLLIDYQAVTNQPTHINLTNHSYFNLCGARPALDQQLMISATEILGTDDLYIPTGKRILDDGTVYDFTSSQPIRGRREKLSAACFNECYVIGKSKAPQVVLSDPLSKRKMEMTSSYPAILFYSGDHLAGPFKPCQGICLEAMHFPDACNQQPGDSTLLIPGQTYKEQIGMKFSW